MDTPQDTIRNARSTARVHFDDGHYTTGAIWEGIADAIGLMCDVGMPEAALRLDDEETKEASAHRWLNADVAKAGAEFLRKHYTT